MSRQRLSVFVLTTALLTLLAAALLYTNNAANSAPPDAGNQTDLAKALPAAFETQEKQLKELQKQVADLQARVNQMQAIRIVAAGTATIKLPGIQDNKQKVRVKLPPDIVARLGTGCIVELTNRSPTGGSFFVPYWKPAADGFDILVADPSMSGEYQITPRDKQPYYIDWIVVQK
jgi:hypothetical protein